MRVIDLGLINYEKGLEEQLKILDEVHSGEEETIIFCSHEPVLTLGRATKEGDIEQWEGDTYKVQRGGRVTFHGPGQIVAYPILRLSDRKRDLHLYLRNLEEAILQTLAVFGIKGDREEGATGVWVGDKKVASIGVAAKKWITYHGLALNFENEFEKYGQFKPCGFNQEDMIGISELVGNNITIDLVKETLKEKLKAIL